MGWQVGDETLSVERLPGRKRISLNYWIHNPYMAWGQPLAFFKNDEDAAWVEQFLGKLAQGKELREGGE